MAKRMGKENSFLQEKNKSSMKETSWRMKWQARERSFAPRAIMSIMGNFWVGKSMAWEYKRVDKFCTMDISNAIKGQGKGV